MPQGVRDAQVLGQVVVNALLDALGLLIGQQVTDAERSPGAVPGQGGRLAIRSTWLLSISRHCFPNTIGHFTCRRNTRVESAFRDLKTDLVLRPIFHHKEEHADAHILFAVLAYAMSVTLQLRHRQNAGTLTTPALLEALERVQLAGLSFRTLDGMTLRFERASVPTAEQQRIHDSLGWPIPEPYLGTDHARL